MTGGKLGSRSHHVTFRAPNKLVAGLERAAGHDFMSVSDVIRQALSRDLRSRGMIEANAA